MIDKHFSLLTHLLCLCFLSLILGQIATNIIGHNIFDTLSNAIKH